ncbi:MAG: TauD/TfdA family dioxygenase [Rhizobiaceae bacterium]
MLKDDIIATDASEKGPNEKSSFEIQKYSIFDGYFSIIWTDGHKAEFSFAWLRDWCSCETCSDRHNVDSAAMLDINFSSEPREVKVKDRRVLQIIWKADGHDSTYSSEWLRRFGNTTHKGQLGYSGRQLASNLQSINYKSLRKDEATQLRLLEGVRDFGFTLIRDVPNQPEEVAKLALCLGYIPGGWRYAAQPEEILVAPARPNEKDGFDSEAEAMLEAQDAHFRRTLLVPHTDFSFTSWPTGLFVFHCLRPSPDGGGKTILVDGFHVAERLRAENPAAFKLLSSARYPFRGHGSVKKDWHSHARVISTDEHGKITGIRFALGSRMPLPSHRDPDGAYTKAIQAMLRLVLDPSCQIHLQLSAGDCLVMDNHRILHGRTGMDPQASDTRWFRRFDIERDAAQSRMISLARKLNRSVDPLPSGAHG